MSLKSTFFGVQKKGYKLFKFQGGGREVTWTKSEITATFFRQTISSREYVLKDMVEMVGQVRLGQDGTLWYDFIQAWYEGLAWKYCFSTVNTQCNF